MAGFILDPIDFARQHNFYVTGGFRSQRNSMVDILFVVAPDRTTGLFVVRSVMRSGMRNAVEAEYIPQLDNKGALASLPEWARLNPAAKKSKKKARRRR